MRPESPGCYMALIADHLRKTVFGPDDAANRAGDCTSNRISYHLVHEIEFLNDDTTSLSSTVGTGDR